MVAEASGLFRDASSCFRSTESHTPFLSDSDPSFAKDHPRNREQLSSKHIVDFDRLASTSPLRAMERSPDLLELVSNIACGDPAALHRSACPFNRAYYNQFKYGDGLGWHFDRSAFGVNLLLQSPEAGGEFQLHHNTRQVGASGHHEGNVEAMYASVGDVMDGRLAPSSPQGAGPGSLIVFAGRNSLHRVSPVRGCRPRLNAIITFETEPGVTTNAYTLARFFGR